MVPNLSTLIRMAEKAHRRYPQASYTAVDWSRKGIVIVEVLYAAWTLKFGEHIKVEPDQAVKNH